MTDPDALLETARAQECSGDDAAAFQTFKACAQQHPGTAPAWLGAARILIRQGDRGLATQVLSTGLRAVGDADRGRLAAAFAAQLGAFSGRAYHPKLEHDLVACFAEPGVEHQALARVTAELLLAREAAGAVSADLDAVARDPLWLAFLSLCLNVEAAMEARLVTLRAALIDRVGQDRREATVPASLEPLTCALALQAFAGEYLAPPFQASDPLLRTLSAPLTALSPDPVLTERLAAIPGGLGSLLLKRTLDDLVVERRLARAFPTLTDKADAEDAVSAAVRHQYELNPYPRWSEPPTPDQRPLASVIAALPGITDPGPVRRLLIAGCGTGYEAIDLARTDPTLSIIALDLSRPSLAYGARMATELGVRTIDFRQGDILHLESLEGGFDVAVSTGVLHHMDDPAAGLAAVVRTLRPGGIIRLGLYSERARAAVRAAQSEITARGLTTSPDDIRAFRRIVLDAPATSPLAPLRTSDDFYSLSGCRDLAFHVQERAYDPSGLAALLSGAGLALVGFDAPEEAMARFRERHGAGANPLDLILWDAVEADHPGLFAGMYHLWARKRA
ncbi:class I SAM-dependent methyltransferase [Brevundimonas goettingensis]|uniref:Class I SAM-dependent methyltransferase n=1 Tax=Brevundimonas goettingensis TaxID=2774190 RepID=A0A975C2K6_9CAUL|nr:class I SAM-dependent methyltransferase [Brevundimonas goettingensis]QTC91904.1 class I SAM-dependent methyltransferase [Brevundimonas goettingensis]